MISQRNVYSLGVGRVHRPKYELNDCAVKLQTSAEQVLVQKAHVSARFGSHQFLTGQSHTISVTSQQICSHAWPFMLQLFSRENKYFNVQTDPEVTLEKGWCVFTLTLFPRIGSINKRQTVRFPTGLTLSWVLHRFSISLCRLARGESFHWLSLFFNSSTVLKWETKLVTGQNMNMLQLLVVYLLSSRMARNLRM